ncbi:MAG: hypothetical protein HYX48_07365 [Chlamydiales bacterium]|nr:hypothetical protein [Chlamydiales bacterium]
MTSTGTVSRLQTSENHAHIQALIACTYKRNPSQALQEYVSEHIVSLPSQIGVGIRDLCQTTAQEDLRVGLQRVLEPHYGDLSHIFQRGALSLPTLTAKPSLQNRASSPVESAGLGLLPRARVGFVSSSQQSRSLHDAGAGAAAAGRAALPPPQAQISLPAASSRPGAPSADQGAGLGLLYVSSSQQSRSMHGAGAGAAGAGRAAPPPPQAQISLPAASSRPSAPSPKRASARPLLQSTQARTLPAFGAGIQLIAPATPPLIATKPEEWPEYTIVKEMLGRSSDGHLMRPVFVQQNSQRIILVALNPRGPRECALRISFYQTSQKNGWMLFDENLVLNSRREGGLQTTYGVEDMDDRIFGIADPEDRWAALVFGTYANLVNASKNREYILFSILSRFCRELLDNDLYHEVRRNYPIKTGPFIISCVDQTIYNFIRTLEIDHTSIKEDALAEEISKHTAEEWEEFLGTLCDLTSKRYESRCPPKVLTILQQWQAPKARDWKAVLAKDFISCIQKQRDECSARLIVKDLADARQKPVHIVLMDLGRSRHIQNAIQERAAALASREGTERKSERKS